eukprot:COSAG04_NODE_134_length_23866_cov_4.802036_5_plen_272_part_00
MAAANGGWDGGYWAIQHMDGSRIAGGPTAGLVTGIMGEADFCIGVECDAFIPPAVPVTVHIRSGRQAHQMAWRIGDGHYFGVDPVMEDHHDYTYNLTLAVGEHTMHCYDSHGDGWPDGWWEIRAADEDSTLIAGGLEENSAHPDEGLVWLDGSDVTFTLAADGTGREGSVHGVDLVIHTGVGARTLIFQIDGHRMLPAAPFLGFGLFSVLSGPCTTSQRGNCVGRTNYGDSESCEIRSNAAASVTSCPNFQTESGCASTSARPDFNHFSTV